MRLKELTAGFVWRFCPFIRLTYTAEVAQLEADKAALKEENEQLERRENSTSGLLQNLHTEKEQLEIDNAALRLAANSLLGLIDCLGGGRDLDDAGPDRKQLAELVNYPQALEAGDT